MHSPRPLFLTLFALAAFLPWANAADATTPSRPKITGLSHVALWVKDVDRSRAFFKRYLGFDEPYSLLNPDGSLQLTFIKISDRQWVELFPANAQKPDNPDNLFHVALATDDAPAMLTYLIAKGVKGPGGKPLPTTLTPGKIGNLGYFIEDPDGHVIEIVQLMPQSWVSQHLGQNLPPTAIARRISHAGIMVRDLAATLRFYGDILGFKEFWRGSGNGKELSWVNIRVPDGDDYLELMLYGAAPTAERMHTMNHFCLEVPDVPQVAAILRGRPLPAGEKATSAAKVGVNRKTQINCYDPDGTRVEVMEDHTVDGHPAPSSPAPLPTTGPS
jgi:catechol 2,3-dioxygenase-like lactoylglutathione lyase family enzyme